MGEYAADGREDPTDAATGRWLRGGSWIDHEFYVRAAVHGWNDPHYRGRLIGFRVVLAPPLPIS